MADISDVEQAVADTITAILYPAGLEQSSITGVLCRIYRGWPNSATLNSDLSAGIVNISISIDNESGRTTTRYLSKWHSKLGQPGAVAKTNGQAITITGTPAAGDVVGALVDGKSYVYRIIAGDSVNLVAANLGRLISENAFVNVQQSAISVPGAGRMKVRVVCDNTASAETRRQEKDLRISCWCPSPQIRDAATATIDLAIDRFNFLPLPDEVHARIIYRNTGSYDQAQSSLLYRRDLVYSVEYPTISVIHQPSMLFSEIEINDNITYG